MDGVMHPSVEQAIGRDRVRNALKRYENRPVDEHRYGIVRSVNSDGSYEVLLDGDAQTARCAQFDTALVGDRVIVVVKKDGTNDILGRLGGPIGGGGEVVMTVNDASNYVAGKVFAYAGTDEPIGCLLCDGRAVSRTMYWELFDAIGTTYGAGDGSSTFNLPNIESRTIIGESDSYALGATGGEEKHTLTESELPSLDGSMYFRNWTWGGDTIGTIVPDVSGIASRGGNVSSGYDTLKYGESQGSLTRIDIGFGSDQPHNNMQPYIVMRYFITTGKGDPVSGINPADYVVEWGTDEETGWHYQKFASGWAKLWLKRTIEGLAPYGTWNNEHAYKVETSLPKWVPDNSGTCVAGGQVGSGHATVSRSEIYPTSSGQSYTSVLLLSSASSGTIYLSQECICKWKDSPASGGTESIAPTIAERFEALENESVVASGTSDGWEWIKFANGLAYCEKKVLVSWVSPVSTWGNAYQSSSRYSCGGYPFAFKSTPVVSVTIEGSGQGNYMTGTWTVGQTFGTTTSPPQVWLMNNNGSASYDKGGYLNTKAFGRWK